MPKNPNHQGFFGGGTGKGGRGQGRGRGAGEGKGWARESEQVFS